MTETSAKKLILWMRGQGVAQFQFEGLSVVFHPKAIELPTRVSSVSPEHANPPRGGGLSVEDVLPIRRTTAGGKRG